MDLYETHSISQNIVLRPHWMQYCICQADMIICAIIILTAYFMVENKTLALILKATFVFLLLYLIYKIAEIRRIKYVITDEQILFIHGIANAVTDYIELYRVYDYQQSSDYKQQLTGLKTITIMANDRNTPVLYIIGMKRNNDIISLIRERVEINKQKKYVYEIANTL